MTSNHLFSERETAVIALLTRGMSNKQIALSLGLSVRTVEFHLTNIYAKLSVASRAEAIVALAETHRWESTVDEGQHRTEDTTGLQPTRRIPMRTLPYIGAVSLALLLVALLVMTKILTPSSAPVPTHFSSATATSSPPPPTATSTSTNAPSSAAFHTPPLSYTSATGIAVEVSEFAYGPNCLRLQTLVSGLQAPNGTRTEDALYALFSDVSLFDAVASLPLNLTQIGGGGGGGQAADGSVFIGQEAVYIFSPQLSPEGLVLLTIELFTEDNLGFDGPLTFNLQAIPSDLENCGFQGSLGP